MRQNCPVSSSRSSILTEQVEYDTLWSVCVCVCVCVCERERGHYSEVSSLRSLKLCCAKVAQTAPLHPLPHTHTFTEIQPNVLYCNCDKWEVNLWMCCTRDSKHFEASWIVHLLGAAHKYRSVRLLICLSWIYSLN